MGVVTGLSWDMGVSVLGRGCGALSPRCGAIVASRTISVFLFAS